MNSVMPSSRRRNVDYHDDAWDADAIKDWLAEEHAYHPFVLEGPLHHRLECELRYFRFSKITVSKMETHDVYIFKGHTGDSGCDSEAQFERLLKELARGIGLKIRADDAAISYSRGRFRVVLCL